MNNPFKTIFEILCKIEKLLLNLNHNFLLQTRSLPSQWLDLNELVEYDPEKRSKPTFYGYIHNNTIPYYKRGKKLTFLKSEIDEWLKSGRVKTNLEIQEEANQYLSTKKGSKMENNTTNNPEFLSDKEQGKDNQFILNKLGNAIDNEMNSENNSFPIDIFPKSIQNLIINAEKTVGYNPDFLSAGILSVTATAIGNSVSINNGGYISKPILWLSIIGRSGVGKTHPLEFAKKPIEEKDKQGYINYIDNLKNYNKDDNGKKPYYSKFILTDFTPEKLAENLQFNEKGALIFKDELIGWINNFDKYKSGADQQLYLELFNSGLLTVDRVTKDPIRVEKTNVNILGGMQPSLLKTMAGNNRNNDGFLTRFLFVYPNITKPNLFTGESIPKIDIENYNRLINNLLEIKKTELTTTSNINEIYKNWQHPKADECFKDDLETMIQSKLQTYVWRLALVLEMIKQAVKSDYSDTLSDQSIIDAIRLVEYFRANILKVHDTINNTNPLEYLEQNKFEAYQELPNEFKRKDALLILKKQEISGDTVRRFLNDKRIFIHVKYGVYKKKY